MTRKKFRAKLAKRLRKTMDDMTWKTSHERAKKLMGEYGKETLPVHYLEYDWFDFLSVLTCKYLCDDCERGNWCGRG